MTTPHITLSDSWPLWTWINERHAIYLRRQTGADKPWTSDAIFQQYRFCNVFRELDTVTRWIDEHIRRPYAEEPTLPFMLCLARIINWPDTLEHLMHAGLWPVHGWDPAAVLQVLEYRAHHGAKVYTGAYMLRSDVGSKHRYYVDTVLTPVWNRMEEWRTLMNDTQSLEKATDWLASFYGWGPFLAYEVVTDLRHTQWLRNASDLMTWANAGPGALRGLNRLLNRPLTEVRSQQDACFLMQQLLSIANGPRSPLAKFVPLPLEMRDIEHSLCEMDKYLRVANGEGRPRAKFNGV